jgi:putative ABC transport system permease protein
LTPNNLTNEFLTVIARLKPNVTVQQAQAEMDTIAASLREQFMPGMDNSGWGLLIQPFHELVVGEIRPALMVLMGVVGLVLLIACVNVANLLLARAAVRRKEIAIRAALGAGRKRIVRQLLTESVLLAFLGGAVGLLLGYWGVKALVAIDESRIPRSHEITLDYRVVGFALVVSIVTGLLFGLLPAFQAARTDLNRTLKEGGRSGSGGVKFGLRGALVVVEVAVALMVLAAAGLFLKSFARLQQVDPGFKPQNVISMQLSLPDFKYREASQRDLFFKQALEQIRALPGVESAGAVSILPMSGTNSSGSFRIEGRQATQGETLPHGDRWSATSDYFKALQVPLIRGRFFDDRDTADSAPVALLDETIAKKYWPDDDPIGRRISFEGGRDNPRWREVVGIVGHAKHRGLEGESRVQYYIPYSQRPLPNMFVVARTKTDPADAAGSIRGTIRSIDPDLPVFRVTTMEQLVKDSTAQRRFSILLLGVFATVALLLAAVGLYGVMGYSVSQRTQEIGVRMALGAGRADVLRLVTTQGMALTAIGLFIGLAASLGFANLIAGLLFGVSAYDPVIFSGMPFVLAGVALVACFVPARRASRVDPITALRYE